MGNPQRGHVDLRAGDESYRLCFSINAICELEEETGKTINQISESLNDPQTMRMSLARAVFWGATRDAHPELTVTDAGAVIDEVGFHGAMEAIGQAFMLAFPQTEASDSGRPRKAGKAGRG